MKIKRILSLPFTIIADAITLGNVGGVEGAFTQQLFDAEKREQRHREQRRNLDSITTFIKVLKE